MDFHNSRYFNINKKMLRYMGLWPYQNRIAKVVIPVMFGSLMGVCMLPQLISLYKYRKDDIDKILQSVATLCYLLGIGLKFVTQIASEQKIEIVYQNIVKNWEFLDGEDEKATLIKYSEIGRFLTVGYVSYMFSALILFITMPVLPFLLDKFMPLDNGSWPLMYILDGEFGVDRDENYGKIYLFEACTCILTVFTFSTIDSTYAVCVQQCVGLMAVVKNRLKDSTFLALREKDDETIAAYNGIVKSIILHKQVLQFAGILESSYTTSFLVVMACNVAMISIGCVVLLVSLNKPMQFMRYCLIFVGVMIHMFYISFPGQKLIDSSGGIFDDAYNSHWYACSNKTKKLLRLLMLRSLEPCYLTAGGICVMNIANCSALLKTSMSYITVFASFR